MGVATKEVVGANRILMGTIRLRLSHTLRSPLWFRNISRIQSIIDAVIDTGERERDERKRKVLMTPPPLDLHPQVRHLDIIKYNTKYVHYVARV